MRAEGRLSRRDRVLALVVPVVMVVFALVAVERHHRVDQSPWQGFGFGMFSSYEHRHARTLRATALIDGGEQPVPVPGELSDLADRVRVAPGDRQSEQLARELLARAGAERLTLEVWGHEVDSDEDSLTIGFRVIERVVVP